MNEFLIIPILNHLYSPDPNRIYYSSTPLSTLLQPIRSCTIRYNHVTRGMLHSMMIPKQVLYQIYTNFIPIKIQCLIHSLDVIFLNLTNAYR